MRSSTNFSTQNSIENQFESNINLFLIGILKIINPVRLRKK